MKITLIIFSLLLAPRGKVFRLEEKTLEEIRIRTGEIEQRQKNKDTCSEQHVGEGIHLPSDTLWKKMPFVCCS